MNASQNPDEPDPSIIVAPSRHDEGGLDAPREEVVMHIIDDFGVQLKGSTDIPLELSLRDVLGKELEGVQIEDVKVPEGLEGKDVFRISVKDKEKWLSPGNLDVLAKHFGKDIWGIFINRDDPAPFRSDDPSFMDRFKQEYLLKGDIAEAVSIYMVCEGGKILGFYMLKRVDLEDGSKPVYALLTHINHEVRGKLV